MIRSIRPAPLMAGALALACAIPVVHADNAPPPVGWTGQGQAGLVLTRGNADTTTANAKLDASDTIGDWKHLLHLAYLYGQSAGIASAQRFEGGWQSDYNFTKKTFVFGSLTYENDHFDGFVYQATLTTGLGYKFIDSDTTKLVGTLGFGYRRLQPETFLHNDPDPRVITGRIRGESTSDGIGSAGLDYAQKLTNTTKLTDRLLVQSGGQNTAVANDLAIVVNMTDALALSVGYGVRYNSNPPAGTQSTDQLTTLNVVYSFNQPKKQ
jgi:putative salt-induced outer membrane protein